MRTVPYATEDGQQIQYAFVTASGYEPVTSVDFFRDYIGRTGGDTKKLKNIETAVDIREKANAQEVRVRGEGDGGSQAVVDAAPQVGPRQRKAQRAAQPGGKSSGSAAP